MILNFFKGFLTLFLLIKVLLHVVPKNVFEKYIAFFSGVILVIGLLYPVLQVMRQEELVLEKMQYEHWEEELLKIADEASKLEKAGGQVMEEYYRKLSEEDLEIESVVIETIKIESGIQSGGVNE